MPYHYRKLTKKMKCRFLIQSVTRHNFQLIYRITERFNRFIFCPASRNNSKWDRHRHKEETRHHPKTHQISVMLTPWCSIRRELISMISSLLDCIIRLLFKGDGLQSGMISQDEEEGVRWAESRQYKKLIKHC